MKIKEKEEKQPKKELKRVFNENILKGLKNKEIKELEKQKKDILDYYDGKIKEKNEEIKEQRRIEKLSGKKMDSEYLVDLELLEINKKQEKEEIDENLKNIKEMTLYKFLKYHLENEKKKLKKKLKKKNTKKRNIKRVKAEKVNKKIKEQNDGKMDEEDDNFDQETRDEIGNTMRPVFELKKLQEDNEEINYNFEF